MTIGPLNILYTGTPLAGCTETLQHVGRAVTPRLARDAFLLQERPHEVAWAHGARTHTLRLFHEYYGNLYVPSLRAALNDPRGFDPPSEPRDAEVKRGPPNAWHRSWRALAAFLRRVDGIVFVADSQIEEMEGNIARVERLARDLGEAGRDPTQIALVVQVNKRDLPTSIDSSAVRAKLFWPGGADYVDSVATRGVGTLEALATLVARLTHAAE